jgi:hypothetical protein
MSALKTSRFKDDWERRIPKDTAIPMASKMMAFLRLVVSLLRVGLGAATLRVGPAERGFHSSGLSASL